MDEMHILMNALDYINEDDIESAEETLDMCDNEAADLAFEQLQQGNICMARSILEDEIDELGS